MTTTPINAPAASPASPKKLVFPKASFSILYGDRIYAAITFLASLSIFGIIVWLAVQLSQASGASIHKFGWSYITQSNWDETKDIYGILPYIFGTLYSSFLALLIAVPISIGSAVFLSELAPKWLRTPMTFLIELLAAIPSVVYGLWGIFVMLPWLKTHVMNPISHAHPHNKFALWIFDVFFSGNPYGPSMLAAGLILSIMVIPFITAVTRDILKAIPRSQREGSYALGATQWETISQVVFPYAKSGIVGAVMLGLGRALGETMAVTMLIGNQSPGTPTGISFSLFQPGYTMASALANKFTEAAQGINTSALAEIGLVLFFVTIVVNMAARLLVFYTAKDVAGGK
ncbi:MAG: phosphate ABC transporter permease subunit PstC [Capsulimonas sp.]|uniref:phosphate ABC transporter permease subunit PstC n=1 Tax=Capsulimonas sp. TaxID=2494211 RepID=UPI00326513EF